MQKAEDVARVLAEKIQQKSQQQTPRIQRFDHLLAQGSGSQLQFPKQPMRVDPSKSDKEKVEDKKKKKLREEPIRRDGERETEKLKAIESVSDSVPASTVKISGKIPPSKGMGDASFVPRTLLSGAPVSFVPISITSSAVQVPVRLNPSSIPLPTAADFENLQKFLSGNDPAILAIQLQALNYLQHSQLSSFAAPQEIARYFLLPKQEQSASVRQQQSSESSSPSYLNTMSSPTEGAATFQFSAPSSPPIPSKELLKSLREAQNKIYEAISQRSGSPESGGRATLLQQYSLTSSRTETSSAKAQTTSAKPFPEKDHKISNKRKAETEIVSKDDVEDLEPALTVLVAQQDKEIGQTALLQAQSQTSDSTVLKFESHVAKKRRE